MIFSPAMESSTKDGQATSCVELSLRGQWFCNQSATDSPAERILLGSKIKALAWTSMCAMCGNCASTSPCTMLHGKTLWKPQSPVRIAPTLRGFLMSEMQQHNHCNMQSNAPNPTNLDLRNLVGHKDVGILYK